MTVDLLVPLLESYISPTSINKIYDLCNFFLPASHWCKVFLFVRLLTSIRLRHFLSQVLPPNKDVVSMSNFSSLCVSCLSSVAWV